MKALLKRFLPHLPRNFQEAVRKWTKKKRVSEAARRKTRTKVTLDEILYKLALFDLSTDFIIHSSVSNIGKLDFPVSELVDRWLRTLDLAKQSVICPALPYNSTMEEYLAKGQPFNIASAPNAMGLISNTLMKLEGAKRSLHPTHSCIAIGRDAEYYTNGHENDSTPFGKNSPFRKLTDRKGKILMFGVGLNSVTNFHVYEDMLGDSLPFKVYMDTSFAVPCVDINGKAITVSTRCHDPKKSAIRECEVARPFLEEAGAIVTQQIGESELSLIDARLFSIVLLRMLLSGTSIYGKVRLDPDQKAAVECCLKELQ